MGSGRGSQVIPLRMTFLVPLIVSFHVRKSYMSNVNLRQFISQIMYGKEKKLWTHDSIRILHPAFTVYTVGQMLIRTLDVLYFCAT